MAKKSNNTRPAKTQQDGKIVESPTGTKEVEETPAKGKGIDVPPVEKGDKRTITNVGPQTLELYIGGRLVKIGSKETKEIPKEFVIPNFLKPILIEG